MDNQENWPYQEAKKIIESFGNSIPEVIYLETGYGPSGPPHLGTFGEIARTMFVQFALKELGHTAKIIAFSDDLDALRKVPTGFPEELKIHLGKPVSKIPDPLGVYRSYSDRMNSLLREMVDLAGATVDFKYSSEEYEKGSFNEEIKKILSHHEEVTKIVTGNYSLEARRNWFPFFVTCKNCGNAHTTRILEIDANKAEVRYACDQTFDTISGCGYVGESSALNGNGKLPWKVDWAVRWHAYNIRYEIFGKDLIPSAEVSDRICREIFNWDPPVHMFYELFLDTGGRKISKSKGDVISPTMWLKYGSMESLYYLFLYKPREAKRISLLKIPDYMDDVLRLEQEYFSNRAKNSKSRTEYQFITRFNPPEKPTISVSFSLLTNIIASLGVNDLGIVREYVKKALAFQKLRGHEDSLEDQIDKAVAFYNDVVSPIATVLDFSNIKDEELQSLEDLHKYLLLEERSDIDIHNKIFELSKRNSINAAGFFKTLYIIIIGQENGPRLGSFIKLLGQNFVCGLLLRTISKIELAKEFATLKEQVLRELYQYQPVKEAKMMPGKGDEEKVDEKFLREIQNARTVPTQKMFKDDPYCHEFDAVVTGVSGTKINLDRTYFYPVSGGQAGDTGEIDGRKVVDTQYEGGDIVHVLQDVSDLKVGDKVHATIDWERRYRIMKLHSACHVMEYYLFKVFGHLERVGSFVNEQYDKSTYAFLGRLPDDQLKEVENLVNSFLAQNFTIERVNDPKYPEFRIWVAGEIREPCGGTHPKNTQEIGKILLKRRNAGSGKESVVTMLTD